MSKIKILDNIHDPSDLTYLSELQLTGLAEEIRQYLIQSVSQTGGHLASNLGVVELTIALHKIFRSAEDQIVWDVGHQSYTHKILTGRKELMTTLRQKDGISGFPKAKESVHDAFISGHASTSISAAAGIAKAKLLKGEKGHVIAVIGDGALTGGLSYEGLNNAAKSGGSLIVILNDNKMSISKNVGSITGYLSRLRTNPSYFRLKDITKSAMRAIPLVGESMVEMVSASKSYLKSAVYSDTSFFEELGFIHLGPVDGHNISMLCDVLRRARSIDKPVLIHVETVKGKGYPFAEENPGAYHGVSRFNPKIGNGDTDSTDNYSTVFGRHLTRLAVKDNRICAVTAAMKYGTRLNYFSRMFKQAGRFFDVGIAESHAVTFCAGLASKGLLPVFAVYSSFLQRSYDQIVHDCAIEPKHVILAVDRAGLVGEDGETHQGLFDCSFLSGIPGTTIFSPATYQELEYCLEQALYEESGVCAVRYPRGSAPSLDPACIPACSPYHYVDSGAKEKLVITYGRVYAQVVQAIRSSDHPVSVLKLTKVWPFDEKILELAEEYANILFVEEGIITGGIGEHLLLRLHRRGWLGGYHVQGIDNGFVQQASVEEQMKMVGLDSKSIQRLL